MWKWLVRTYSTSIGRKLALGVSGLALVGFLIVHLAGNLSLYADGGKGEAFDHYAALLESNPLLPVAEILLLALFVLHIGLAVKLSAEAREARGSRYAVRATFGQATPSSRSMIVTGLVVLAFLVVHIFDFRMKKLFASEEISLAALVRERLSSPLGMTIYALGSVVLGVHLAHGIQSVFQTVGLNHPRWTPLFRNAGRGLAVVLALGFLSFPVVVFFVWRQP